MIIVYSNKLLLSQHAAHPFGGSWEEDNGRLLYIQINYYYRNILLTPLAGVGKKAMGDYCIYTNKLLLPQHTTHPSDGSWEEGNVRLSYNHFISYYNCPSRKMLHIPLTVVATVVVVNKAIGDYNLFK